MTERRRRATPSSVRARIVLAAAVCAAAALLALLLLRDSDPRDARAVIHEPPPIIVPVAAHESLIPAAARSSIDRAVQRCRRDPSPDAFAALGRIYHGNALTRLAAECYEIALDLGAADAQTPYLLALILFEEGREVDAIARFRTAIERDATYPLAHHHLGRALLHAGAIDEAVQAMSLAVELDGGDAVLRAGLAQALRQAGRLDDAETAALEALRLDPDHAAAHQVLGLILHAAGRSDEAQHHLARTQRYNTTVYNDPWMWEAYRHAASVETRLEWAQNLLRFGRVESAIALLQELSRRHTDHHGVFAALANAHLAAGDHQRALNAFNRAADLDPTDAPSRLAMAQILLAYDMLDDADAEARSAMEIDPKLADALIVRGTVALRRGMLDEAKARLEHAFRERPTSIRAAAMLGETLIEMQRYEDAVNVLQQVLPAGGSRAAYAEFQLAAALAHLGRIVEAKDALRRAAEIEPDNEHIRAKLAALEEAPER